MFMMSVRMSAGTWPVRVSTAACLAPAATRVTRARGGIPDTRVGEGLGAGVGSLLGLLVTGWVGRVGQVGRMVWVDW